MQDFSSSYLGLFRLARSNSVLNLFNKIACAYILTQFSIFHLLCKIMYIHISLPSVILWVCDQVNGVATWKILDKEEMELPL